MRGPAWTAPHNSATSLLMNAVWNPRSIKWNQNVEPAPALLTARRLESTPYKVALAATHTNIVLLRGSAWTEHATRGRVDTTQVNNCHACPTLLDPSASSRSRGRRTRVDPHRPKLSPKTVFENWISSS